MLVIPLQMPERHGRYAPEKFRVVTFFLNFVVMRSKSDYTPIILSVHYCRLRLAFFALFTHWTSVFPSSRAIDAMLRFCDRRRSNRAVSLGVQ